MADNRQIQIQGYRLLHLQLILKLFDPEDVELRQPRRLIELFNIILNDFFSQHYDFIL